MRSLLEDAIKLARDGWQVFALNGKTPYRNCPSCKGAGCNCDPAVHLLCHGFHAATTDEGRLEQMWAAYPRSNIGLRPASGFFVVDVDPRHGGTVNPRWPATRRAWTGGADGGCHLWYDGKRPPGKLGPGVDIRDWGGYVVAPPSIHPESGKPYRWDDYSAPIATWDRKIQGERPASARYDVDGGPRYENVGGTWEGVLLPEGWTTNGKGDWLHPQASTTLSARVIGDLLYVFSTSTEFEATSGGAPRGYDRAEAYALLNGLDIYTPEGLIASLQALEEML